MQPILTRLAPIESGVGFHQLQPVPDRGRAGLTQTGTAGTETPVVNSVCVRKLYIPTAAGDGKHKQGIFAVIKTDIETFLPDHLSMYQLHARPAKILLGLIERLFALPGTTQILPLYPIQNMRLSVRKSPCIGCGYGVRSSYRQQFFQIPRRNIIVVVNKSDIFPLGLIQTDITRIRHSCCVGLHQTRLCHRMSLYECRYLCQPRFVTTVENNQQLPLIRRESLILQTLQALP